MHAASRQGQLQRIEFGSDPIFFVRCQRLLSSFFLSQIDLAGQIIEKAEQIKGKKQVGASYYPNHTVCNLIPCMLM